MKFSKNNVLAVLITIGIAVILIGSNKSSVPSLDDQLAQANDAANKNYMAQENTTPLSNTNATLSTIVADYQKVKSEMNNAQEQIQTLKSQNDKLMRELTDKSVSNPDIAVLQNTINNLQNQINDLEDKAIQNTKIQTTNTQSPFDVTDITGGDIQPIEIPNRPVKTASTGNSLLDQLAPQEVVDSLLNTNTNEVQPIGNATVQVGGQTVVITQSDVVFVENKKTGQFEKTYPIQVATLPTTLPSESDDGTAGAVAVEEDKEVPIYTIPAGATLFDSIAMSALIGRIPIDNKISNPYRFKVLVGSENLASNGFYIPNLRDMILLGNAEGDFTANCTRGHIDVATFTFLDGTVRTVRGSKDKPLAYLSDDSANPCITGRFISNWKEFVATQGGLAALGALAASYADAAVTTSTSAEGVTTQVVKDASQKAIGEGAESGVSEVLKWHAERQSSAFDVVYVKPGEPVTVNIEEEIRIDYEPNGRKLFHEDNAREYLGW